MPRRYMWIWSGAAWALLFLVTLVLASLISAKWDLDHPQLDDNGNIKKDSKGNIIYQKIGSWRPDQCEGPLTNRDHSVDPCLLTDPAPGKDCPVQNDHRSFNQDDHTILEPWNAWSNLAYLAAGLLILFRDWRRWLFGWAVGLNLVLLALFSGLYHGSLQSFPQALDVNWIYAVMLCLIIYAAEGLTHRHLHQWIPGPWKNWVIFAGVEVGVVVLTVLKSTNVWAPDSTTVFIALVLELANLVVLSLYLMWQREPDVWGSWETWFFPCLIAVLAGAAFFFRLMDGWNDDGTAKRLCSPTAAIQAHALWHILGAGALLFTFDYFARVSGRGDRIFGDD